MTNERECVVKPVVAKHLETLIQRYPSLESCHGAIVTAFDSLCTCYRAGGKLLVCGNGGSAADTEHLVGELMNKYLFKRTAGGADRARIEQTAGTDAAFLLSNLQPAFPAISLVSQSALITSISNDSNADMVFAQQVFGYGKQGDILVAISTSGTSRNVVLAVRTARARGMKTIAMTGQDGRDLQGLCDICLCVPETTTFKVQELHLPVYHALCAMVEEELFR